MINSMSRRIIFFFPVFLLCLTLSAQEVSDYEKAKAEIVQTFGIFPTMFEVFPQHALPGAWDNFKQLQSPDCCNQGRYREYHSSLLRKLGNHKYFVLHMWIRNCYF